MAEPTQNEASQRATTPPPSGRALGGRLSIFDTLQDEVERFWDLLPLMPRAVRRQMGRLPQFATTWAPVVDMFERGGEIVVKAELPGVKKEDVRLSLDEGDLVIEGERRAEIEVKEKDYYRMERSSGSFFRRLPLPEGVKVEHVRASFSDGVLEVHVPKPPEPQNKGKTIPVT